jgi:hypothetical protein
MSDEPSRPTDPSVPAGPPAATTRPNPWNRVIPQRVHPPIGGSGPDPLAQEPVAPVAPVGPPAVATPSGPPAVYPVQEPAAGGLMAMDRLHWGIALVFYGLELIAGAILVTLLLTVWLFFDPFAAFIGWVQWVAAALPLIEIGAIGLTMTGKCLCLSAPPQMRGREMVIASVALDSVALLIAVVDRVVNLPQMVDAASGLLVIAGFVVFLLFLRRLAEHIGDTRQAEKAGVCLKLGIAVVVAVALAVLCRAVHEGAAIYIALGALAFALILLARYARLLLNLKNALAIARMTSHAPPGPGCQGWASSRFFQGK